MQQHTRYLQHAAARKLPAACSSTQDTGSMQQHTRYRQHAAARKLPTACSSTQDTGSMQQHTSTFILNTDICNYHSSHVTITTVHTLQHSTLTYKSLETDVFKTIF
jgi:hypothetical protein